MNIQVKNITIGNNLPLVLIAGPCQIESLEHADRMAESIVKICKQLDIQLIYKSSYDKANRTSLNGKRGIGMKEGLKILSFIKEKYQIPVLTDVHDISQVKKVAQVVDVIQIPAFLCRQTDLLVECAKMSEKYNCAVNVKKGQFLAPWDMINVINKLTPWTPNVMACERGTSFGYNTLISDMRSLEIMKTFGYPVVFDATHSVQNPGGQGISSGGDRAFVPPLARAAVAVGVSTVFMEVHDNPDIAPSDGPNMLKIDDLYDVVLKLQSIDKLIKELK